ncbi:heat shock protein 70 family, peptide-binding domain protein [Artemisia annua]|uniref:Heat shock protein 70 family, peptide-binding domain protein n=1 Tax=Artemisia annua TaxID=35608 RepID=A0A2U1PP95_ARTAN|nr:heat shock protein 70 family, peptide-binding domain protein [Artemisia annua]
MSERVEGTAIGIDLGTTYSCAAIWIGSNNRVEIIPNEQGNRITPSCVAFNDSELLVGESAKNQIARNPTNTVFDVKRLIGKRFSDPQVQNDMKMWPFKVMKGASEKPSVVVEYKGEEKKFAPEELSAMVLKKMKETAELFLGEEVKNAVITVPAYFNSQQREATKEAGTRAGLNVLRLLNEPTAAAIAYGVDNLSENNWNKDKKTVLVFDLGGGTFDVSLLTISKKGVIEVKAVGGDTHLGGEDFDAALVNYCINEFKKKNTGVNILNNPRALGRLKVACEKAKRDLSSTVFTPIEIDCLHEGIDFYTKITRAKFEELNATYFDKCIQLLERCLLDGKMKKKDVDEVVLVGGSSRIPKVQRMVEEFFGGKTLCRSLNGDEAVASGAAILAARLSGDVDDVKKDVVLLDVTPHSFGIRATKNDEKGRMAVIIPRNTCIPISKKKKFKSHTIGATSLRIAVYQGEGVKAEDNILLGEFSFRNLVLGTNGKVAIEVCFDLDSNGILLVTAEDLGTGRTTGILLTTKT